jgi:UDPglucose--hexose-1-phosphate uridylyltransferase
MGLAVLPARLAKKISLLEDAMLNGENLYACPELTHHAEWADEILKRYPDFCKANARVILEQEIGKVFLKVLEDAGVFKRNDEGKNSFTKFIKTI